MVRMAEGKDSIYIVVANIIKPSCSQNEHGDDEEATGEVHRIEADEKRA